MTKNTPRYLLNDWEIWWDFNGEVDVRQHPSSVHAYNHMTKEDYTFSWGCSGAVLPSDYGEKKRRDKIAKFMRLIAADYAVNHRKIDRALSQLGLKWSESGYPRTRLIPEIMSE